MKEDDSSFLTDYQPIRDTVTIYAHSSDIGHNKMTRYLEDSMESMTNQIEARRAYLNTLLLNGSLSAPELEKITANVAILHDTGDRLIYFYREMFKYVMKIYDNFHNKFLMHGLIDAVDQGAHSEFEAMKKIYAMNNMLPADIQRLMAPAYRIMSTISDRLDKLDSNK